MPYRAPNAYARFVKNASAVSSPGSTRVMGLIGTGLNYYEIYNEPVQRNSDRPYDEIMNSNIFEVIAVSQKPYISGNTTENKIYKLTDNFTCEGNKVIWKTLQDASSEKPAMATVGSIAFSDKVTIVADTAKAYLAENGSWIVEVTYVDATKGAYRVINNETKEIIGEYAVGSTPVYAIPGFALTVTSTYEIDENGNVITAAGDYVLINTTAGKTQLEPTLDTVATNTLGYPVDATITAAVKTSLKVYNKDDLKNGTYYIVLPTATSFKVVDSNGNDISSETTIQDIDYYGIIPGVTFKLEDIPTDAEENTTISVKVTRNDNTNAPAVDSLYYVSYKFRKADSDYEPQIFFDYDDVVAEYGNYDVTASGVIINSLSLGAEIAFTNGILPIVCVQAKNDSDVEMEKALLKLQRALPGVDNINTIVPLTDSTAFGATALNHVNIMSSPDNGKERMVYLAAGRTTPLTKTATALDTTMGMVETAKSYNNERVVYIVPGEVTKDIRDLRTGKSVERKLPGCYPAVAVAALGLRNDPAEPLTNKTILGFKSLTSFLMESEKNLLAAAGCCVLEQTGSVIKVRHGITTSIADVDSSEITLVQIRDYVIDSCRKTTAALYTGNKNRPSIVSDVQYTISNILNQLISQQIIIGFNGLSVKRSKDDPRQIDVKFEVEAVYPLNYINISFGFTTIN